MVQLFPLFVLCGFVLASATGAETSSDLVAAESVASEHKAQSVSADGKEKYGYPYMIAPTLEPQIQARSDVEDNEPLQDQSFGARTVSTSNDATSLKKHLAKKAKAPFFSIRRQDNSAEKPFRSYREPKYRNFEELEDSFQPRRMDINIPYSQYDYSKFVPKLSHSPRDPYLSPSNEPIDSFYPSSPKVKSFSSPSGYGTRNLRPIYGAGNYEDPLDHPTTDLHNKGGYGGPSSSYSSPGGPSSSYSSPGGPSSSYSSPGGPSSSYSSPGGLSSSYSSPGGPLSSYPSALGPSSSYSSPGEPSSSYASPGGPSSSYASVGGSVPNYSSSGGSYGFQDYEIKSNEPIMGQIRKKLLDYAGASDLYEGEPDYLQEIARNKHKYGSIGNDYYAYGGPGYRESYRDFPYVESKISLIKKSRRV